jgi:RimJ/RimL family protein N-acetyltransferase
MAGTDLALAGLPGHLGRAGTRRHHRPGPSGRTQRPRRATLATGQAPQGLRSTFARLAADRSASPTAQLNWVVRHRADAEPIGMVQAIFTDGGHAAEIAWVVGTPWQGQGIATEAARAVVDWLHGQGVQTITAWIRPDHHASAAVAGPTNQPGTRAGRGRQS